MSQRGCEVRAANPRLGSLALLAVLFVAACSSGDTVPTSTEAASSTFPQLGEPVERAPLPELDPEAVARGQVLYAANCAVCHGAGLEGNPGWQIQNEDGSFLPPPHDVNGHTWHHADQLLVDIVLNGSDFPQSRMPLFAGALTESDVMDILESFKATWGPTERDVNWQATQRVAAEQR